MFLLYTLPPEKARAFFRLGKGKNALALLDVEETGDAYEVAHLFKLGNKQLRKMVSYLKDKNKQP